MVRITSFSRRTVDTMMALKASLLVLLSMSIACSAMLQIPKELPDMFPAGTLKGTQINAVLERIKGACPPFGNPDERFSVKVLGTTSPEIGGCVSMVPPNRHIVPSFNLWLGSLKFGGGGGCGEKNMDHYVFECMDKHPFFTEEDKLEGWYVMLFDRTARWTGHQDYRCALYKTVNEDPPTIQMMISANQSCKGLSERMKQSEHKVPEGFRHFTDGTVALHFTKDLQQTPVWRKKRSEVQSGGCRFPEWSQGSWTDLKVDGSLALYDSAFHEKDDVDYGQESDDGKDGDAETTSGEQYIQRSQRQKRCAWDVKTTTAPPRDKKFENAARDGHTDGIEFTTKRDPTFPHIPYREKRSLDEDLNEKYKSTENDEEEALKKIKALDQFNRYMRWLNIVNAMVSIKYHRFEQSNKKIKENEYEIFPEDKPVPSPVKYLKFAEMAGIPYKQALINWRSMERAYRQKEAEVAFTAYPGQNHPDIVMKDFDQTFDGIEYDFDPLHPEGTADDPIAYRALTLPIGYQIKPQQSRRTTYEQKQSRDAPESATVVSHFQAVHSNSLNDRTHQENTPSLNQRMRRSSTQQNQQQSATTTFSWSCEMQVDDDEKHFQQPQRGAKFLTYGGRIVENNGLPGNDQHNENDSEKTYGCLWLVPRGPNILEFSIIGTGMPLKNQSMQNFARQLCSENSAIGKDSGVRNEKKLRPRRPWWITETRTDEKKRVPVGCPVPPGIEFYGVVPAPPPPSTVSANKAQPTPLRLCARLVSSADDCTTGQMGPTDQMKYTVSECVEQDSSSTGTAQTVVTSQTIFEEREYQCLGQWTEPQQQISPVAGEKSVMLTYTYLKRLNPITKEGAQYECFVGTPIPNDEGLNPETTTTILLTEAGTNTKCSRLSDPYRSGMKLVGTKIKKQGACKGYAQPAQDTASGSWYSLKPQPISPSIPGTENGGGAWYAAPPIPVVAQGPTTMMPILTGRHTGGNGATFTSRQNEQTRRTQSANPPPKTNNSIRIVVDKRIFILLAVILFAGPLHNVAPRFFN